MNYLLSDDWNSINTHKRIIVYGLGRLAKLYLPKLHKDFSIKFIIDNGANREKSYLGIPVFSFDAAKDKIEGDKIVIVVGTNIAENLRDEVKKYLEKQGLKEFVDFCNIERFALEYYWRFEKRLNVFQIHTAINTNCTLKCKNCNMLIPYYKTKYEYTAADIDKNLSLLMKHVEYIFKYQLVGGEPFLNKEIKRILELIGKKYGNVIAWKRLVTNGTILPGEDIFDILQKYNYDIVLSDYTAQVAYKERIDAFENQLKKRNISYERCRDLTWVDVGLPESIGKEDDRDIKTHMINCASSWHGLADQKLFYCNVAWSAEKCGVFHNTADDYVDLNDLNKDSDLERIVALGLGELPKGYNSLCRYCKGCGTDNRNFVVPGVQC